MSLLMVPLTDITDSNFVSSNVAGDVYYALTQATGVITTPAAGTAMAATGKFTVSITDAVHATAVMVIYHINTGEHLHIAGHQFDFVTARSAAFQVTASTDHATAAANLLTAINTDISDHCTATRSYYTLNLTATSADPAVGNAITIDVSACVVSDVRVTEAFAGGTAVIPNVGDHIHVSAQQFNLVASRGGAGQVTFAYTNSALATNIAAAVNADIADVDATNSYGIVNLVAASTGAAGNAITYVGCSGITADGAHLINGSDTAIVLDQTFAISDQTFIIKASGTITGYVVRSTVSATAQGNNMVTSINRDLSGVVSSSNSSGTVTVTADSSIPGSAGNSIVFTNNNVSGVAFSGSGTLSGGTDASSGYTPWTAKTYSKDEVVVVDAGVHHVYQALKATEASGDYPPDNLDGASPYWLDLGAVNRWKMFDGTTDSQTVNPTSIVVSLTPGNFDTVILFNTCATSINIRLMDGVTEVYNQTITPPSTVAGTFYKTDIPSHALTCVLTVTITNTGSNAMCGRLGVGSKYEVGTILASPAPEIGIIDYSIKEVDDFGAAYIVERAYSKRVTYSLAIPIANHSSIKTLLANYRAIPAAWLGSDTYSILNVYGFPKDWEMTVGPTYVTTTLEIEGWI